MVHVCSGTCWHQTHAIVIKHSSWDFQFDWELTLTTARDLKLHRSRSRQGLRCLYTQLPCGKSIGAALAASDSC